MDYYDNTGDIVCSTEYPYSADSKAYSSEDDAIVPPSGDKREMYSFLDGKCSVGQVWDAIDAHCVRIEYDDGNIVVPDMANEIWRYARSWSIPVL